MVLEGIGLVGSFEDVVPGEDEEGLVLFSHVMDHAKPLGFWVSSVDVEFWDT